MSNIENGKKSKLAELKNNPVKVMALIYPYIMVIGVGIGLFYLAKVNDIQKQTMPPVLKDSLAQIPGDLNVELPKTVPQADVMALSLPSDSLVAAGKALFNTNCVSCHGVNGKGDGVAAAALKPSPRNFTSKDGWINGPKISGIFKTLSEGIRGSAMVAFDTFTPQQKFALAQYIRAAFVPNPPQDAKEELTELSQTYHLSQEQKSPGQIPIADAMVLVNRDAGAKYQKIMDALNMINKNSNDNGAAIFNKITSDKIKALTMLSSTDEWKNNEQTFVDLVVDELNEAGFNDKVHELSNSEWDSFYNYISKVL